MVLVLSFSCVISVVSVREIKMSDIIVKSLEIDIPRRRWVMSHVHTLWICQNSMKMTQTGQKPSPDFNPYEGANSDLPSSSWLISNSLSFQEVSGTLNEKYNRMLSVPGNCFHLLKEPSAALVSLKCSTSQSTMLRSARLNFRTALLFVMKSLFPGEFLRLKWRFTSVIIVCKEL